MPSGVNPTRNNHFEVMYQNPWGGVASNAYPTDIAPSQLVTMDGVSIRNGLICTAAYDTYTGFGFSISPTANGKFIPDLIAAIVFNGSTLYALSSTGKAYVYDPLSKFFALDQTLTGAVMQNFSCYQVVAGVFYIFDFQSGSSYVYTPGISYVVGSIFVAGKYCCTVDEYLLTADSNQPTDAPGIKPNRINWSAPDSFTTWDPSVNRLAGFDVLQDVSDFITGIFAMGNVAYVLRTQGVTQLTPTGIAIQPFNFTPLWNSSYGVGCTFPSSFAQYGAIAIWANDNNIYAFSGSAAPQEITGAAKEAIYRDINQNLNVSATVTNISGAFANTSVDNNTPELVYILSVNSITEVAGQLVSTCITWEYNVSTSTWSRQSTDLGAYLTKVFGSDLGVSANITSSYVNLTAPGVSGQVPRSLYPIILGNAIGGGGVSVSIAMFKRENFTGASSGFTDVSPDITLLFRQEEFKLGRRPEVRTVVVKAAGFGILTIQVGNRAFTDIVLNSSTPKTYYSSGVFTGEDPQLSITSTNFDGFIVKAMLAGTYAEGEVG